MLALNPSLTCIGEVTRLQAVAAVDSHLVRISELLAHSGALTLRVEALLEPADSAGNSAASAAEVAPITALKDVNGLHSNQLTLSDPLAAQAATTQVSCILLCASHLHSPQQPAIRHNHTRTHTHCHTNVCIHIHMVVKLLPSYAA